MATSDKNARNRVSVHHFIIGRSVGVRCGMADWPTFAEILGPLGLRDRELDRALQSLRKSGEIKCVGKRWQLANGDSNV